MQISNEALPGGSVISEDQHINGLVSGDLTIKSEVTAVVSGFVTGDLIVEQHATALVHGTVNGAVHNRGGVVRVTGVIGAIRDEDGISTIVDDGAVVTGLK